QAIDDAYGVAVDRAGNAYVTGHVSSDTINGRFHLVHPFQTSFLGTAFLAKLSPAGTMLINSYYGRGGETREGVATDAFGNVLFVGITGSLHLPTTSDAFQPDAPPPMSDGGFVAILGGANKSYSSVDQDGDLISVHLSGGGTMSVVPASSGGIQ